MLISDNVKLKTANMLAISTNREEETYKATLASELYNG
jgi:hypothetical protein